MEQVLTKTRVRTTDHHLIHTDKAGNTVASFELRDLEEVMVEKRNDYTVGGVASAALIACAVLSKIFIPIPWLSWVSVVVFAVGALLVVLAIFGRDLVVRTSDGVTKIPVNDEFEHAESFALALNHAARRHRFENGQPGTLSNLVGEEKPGVD